MVVLIWTESLSEKTQAIFPALEGTGERRSDIYRSECKCNSRREMQYGNHSKISALGDQGFILNFMFDILGKKLFMKKCKAMKVRRGFSLLYFIKLRF